MSAFDNATLMITGGTGSFGSTVLKHFLDSDLKEIRIFSRDEKKQDDMRHELQAKHPENAKKVKFYIGDVRNPQSMARTSTTTPVLRILRVCRSLLWRRVWMLVLPSMVTPTAACAWTRRVMSSLETISCISMAAI